MAVDFFQATHKTTPALNQTERQLFDYVVKNMHTVKDMSIQKFASQHYLSTTTIFRFTQKLGFTGYSDFINSLLVTSHLTADSEIPSVLKRKVYSEEYLKNIMEAVRVMPTEKIARVQEVLGRKPNVYILTDESANDIGRYCEKLFIGLGLRTYFPEVGYQVRSVFDLIDDDDLIIALSFSGQDKALVETVERIFFRKRPFVLSITRADNNFIQNISDVNFYVFADELCLNGIHLTSHVSMLMILELLVYNQISTETDKTE